MFHSNQKILSAAAVVLCGSSAALAQHADVFLADDGGKVVAGSAFVTPNGAPPPSEVFAIQSLGDRVFEGELLDVGLVPTQYSGDEPGFNGTHDAALFTGAFAAFAKLPGSAAVSFDILSSTVDSESSDLFFWDGTGPVTFAPVTASTVLTVGNPSFASTDGDGAPGFTFANTAGSGFLHHHMTFTVAKDAGTAAADAGFYLLTLQLNVAGLNSSDSLFFVFGTEGSDEAAHEQAIDWVSDNLAAIPEPTTLGLLALAAPMMLRRRMK